MESMEMEITREVPATSWDGRRATRTVSKTRRGSAWEVNFEGLHLTQDHVCHLQIYNSIFWNTYQHESTKQYHGIGRIGVSIVDFLGTQKLNLESLRPQGFAKERRWRGTAEQRNCCAKIGRFCLKIMKWQVPFMGHYHLWAALDEFTAWTCKASSRRTILEVE